MAEQHKKSWLGLLVFVMFISMYTGIGTAQAASDDVSGHWAERVLREWHTAGKLGGYEDGTLRPNQPITRGELFALINRSFGFTAKKEISFSDLNKENWQYADVSAAVQAGYVSGYEDGTIRVKQEVLRQEAVVLFAKAAGFTPSRNAQFADAAQIPAWSAGYAAVLVDYGLLTGYEDGTFLPKRALTRAEAVTILQKVIDSSKVTVYDEPGVYGSKGALEQVQGSVVIDIADVTLQNVDILGDLTITRNVGEGDVYLKNVKVRGTTWIQGGGTESVHLEDAILVKVVIDKVDGAVRLVASGSTVITEVVLNTSAKVEVDQVAKVLAVTLSELLKKGTAIELAGKFEVVNVEAGEIIIRLLSGSVNQLSVDADAADVEINLAAKTTIAKLIANAAAQIVGKGTVDQATINALGVAFDKAPKKMQLGTDAPDNTSITVNGKKVAVPAATSNSGMSGGGGMGGGGFAPSPGGGTGGGNQTPGTGGGNETPGTGGGNQTPGTGGGNETPGTGGGNETPGTGGGNETPGTGGGNETPVNVTPGPVNTDMKIGNARYVVAAGEQYRVTPNFTGEIYVAEYNSRVTVPNVSYLKELESKGKAKKVSVIANQTIAIPVSELGKGSYTLYAVNEKGEHWIGYYQFRMIDGVGTALTVDYTSSIAFHDFFAFSIGFNRYVKAADETALRSAVTVSTDGGKQYRPLKQSDIVQVNPNGNTFTLQLKGDHNYDVLHVRIEAGAIVTSDGAFKSEFIEKSERNEYSVISIVSSHSENEGKYEVNKGDIIQFKVNKPTKILFYPKTQWGGVLVGPDGEPDPEIEQLGIGRIFDIPASSVGKIFEIDTSAFKEDRYGLYSYLFGSSIEIKLSTHSSGGEGNGEDNGGPDDFPLLDATFMMDWTYSETGMVVDAAAGLSFISPRAGTAYYKRGWGFPNLTQSGYEQMVSDGSMYKVTFEANVDTLIPLDLPEMSGGVYSIVFIDDNNQRSVDLTFERETLPTDALDPTYESGSFIHQQEEYSGFNLVFDEELMWIDSDESVIKSKISYSTNGSDLFKPLGVEDRVLLAGNNKHVQVILAESFVQRDVKIRYLANLVSTTDGQRPNGFVEYSFGNAYGKIVVDETDLIKESYNTYRIPINHTISVKMLQAGDYFIAKGGVVEEANGDDGSGFIESLYIYEQELDQGLQINTQEWELGETYYIKAIGHKAASVFFTVELSI